MGGRKAASRKKLRQKGRQAGRDVGRCQGRCQPEGRKEERKEAGKEGKQTVRQASREKETGGIRLRRVLVLPVYQVSQLVLSFPENNWQKEKQGQFKQHKLAPLSKLFTYYLLLRNAEELVPTTIT